MPTMNVIVIQTPVRKIVNKNTFHNRKKIIVFLRVCAILYA
jgi:hypothetical protein